MTVARCHTILCEVFISNVCRSCFCRILNKCYMLPAIYVVVIIPFSLYGNCWTFPNEKRYLSPKIFSWCQKWIQGRFLEEGRISLVVISFHRLVDIDFILSKKVKSGMSFLVPTKNMTNIRNTVRIKIDINCFSIIYIPCTTYTFVYFHFIVKLNQLCFSYWRLTFILNDDIIYIGW